MNYQNQAAEYSPAYTLAKWVNFFLIAYAILMVIAVISDFFEVKLLIEAAAGSRISSSTAEANDSRQALIGTLQFWIFIATAITFLIWMRRAKSNLNALGVPRVEFSGTWAVWGFFIPVASYVIPFRVVREIWQASHPRARTESWESFETSSVVGWWWTFWVIAGILSLMNLRLLFPPPDTINWFVALSVGA